MMDVPFLLSLVPCCWGDPQVCPETVPEQQPEVVPEVPPVPDPEIAPERHPDVAPAAKRVVAAALVARVLYAIALIASEAL